MEESEKKEILHQVKREIYHIKKVTVHTAQQDGEISDPDIAIADTTVKRSQQAAYHLAARTGKLIFQRRQKDTAVRSLQRTKASEKQQKLLRWQHHSRHTLVPLQPKVIPAVHLPIIPGQAVPPLRPPPDLLPRQNLRH